MRTGSAVTGLLVVLAAGPVAAQDVLVIEDVNVVSMDGLGIRPDRTVVVQDGRIAAIRGREDVDLPFGATVVPGRGGYLAPGLIDFHVHLRSPSELVSYLRWGVTSVVQLSGGLSGAEDVPGLRRDLASGRLVGPTLYASGPILDGDPPINASVSVAVRDEADARAAVRDHADRGYDLIKVYNRLPTDVLPAVVDEAHRAGMPVIGHVPRPGDRSTALQAALQAGMDVIAHGEEIFFTRFYAGVDSLLDLGEVPWRGEEGIEEVTRQILEAGAAVVPNLSFVAATRTQLDSIDVLWADPEFEHLEPAVQDFWRTGNFSRRRDVERFSRRETAKDEFLDRLTLAFSRAGVPLLVGTDASFVGLFPGASVHLELRQLVEAGLSPAEAMAAGTSTPGRFLYVHGMSDVPVGVIEVGARADLILLEENPLLDVDAARDPVGVVRGGVWFDRETLEGLRERAR